MSVLTDKLIDDIANLCWHYQGTELKAGRNANCICGPLKDMVYLTKKDMQDVKQTQ